MSASLSVLSHQLRPEDGSEDMVRLVEYWEGRRRGRPAPTRKDIDILDLRRWMGRISLFEVQPDGELRVRVWGSSKACFSGHMRDGVLVRRARPGIYIENGTRDMTFTLASGSPTRFRVDLDLDGFRYHYDRLALPLAAGGGLLPMVMTFVEFDPRRSEEFWRRYLEAEHSPFE